MILICDENLSSRISDALQQRGLDARSFKSLGWLSDDDSVWLPRIPDISESLVVSRDRMMSNRPGELNAIVANNIGIVFLTGGQQPVESVIELLSNSWSLLEELHNNTSRPFVRFLTTDGKLRQRLHGRGL